MRIGQVATLLVVLSTAEVAPALAQRFTFERDFPAAQPITLDVATVRGAIEILDAPDGRAVVEGVATVRVGWDVPQNAVELARRVADAPPITFDGSSLHLRIPEDRAVQRAVTVRYRVRVPRDTTVISVSESGATSIRGIAGSVDLRTQSGAIDLNDLGGAVRVVTGSGDVSANGVSGALSVTTASSKFTGSALGSSLRVRTQSGEITAAFAGAGDADIETGSSAMRLNGLRGGLRAQTQSGRVIVSGAPRRDWSATTGSSSVEIQLESEVGFELDFASRSGSIVIDGPDLQGSREKRSASGTANGGGPMLRIRTGSGSVRLLQSSPSSRR